MVWEQMAQSPTLSNLTHFSFSTPRHPFLTPQLLQSILSSPTMSNDLIELELTNNDQVNDETLHILSTTTVNSSTPNNNNHDPNYSPTTTTTSLKYAKLQKLIISFNQVGDRGVKSIADNLSQLVELDLSSNRRITDASITSLIAAEHNDPLYPYPSLPSLTRLDMYGCLFSHEGCIALSKSQLLDQLEFLELSGTRIKTSGTRALLSSRLVSNLHRLEMYEELTDEPVPTTPGLDLENCAVVIID